MARATTGPITAPAIQDLEEPWVFWDSEEAGTEGNVVGIEVDD